MYTKQPKKLLIINILDILRRYSDEDHRLSQKDIVDILRKEYDMTADRKAVRRNILGLIEFGYDIEYSESVRMVLDGKTGEPTENCIMTDFYLVRDFTDGELRLLIDSLLFSKHIPYSQCMELVSKLSGLSNRYFQNHIKHIRTMTDTAPQNKQLFYTIEVLDEAISGGSKVVFSYNSYGTDKKLHPRLTHDGKKREYVVNPYQIAAVNGRYYLICNHDKYDDVAHYRLDRITDIRMTDEPAKPVKKVRGLENGIDLPRHMAEHVYMFSGGSETVTFRLKKYIINDVIDWFGAEVSFFDETDDEVTAKVRVNVNAMRRWALQYALHARVLTPAALAQQVREDIRTAAKYYG
ncbi:MAG: WYL domain-containing protein, partial [Clostridia bacterium]|nr:WYL domain-containing protein [Clostridia bacterium]